MVTQSVSHWVRHTSQVERYRGSERFFDNDDAPADDDVDKNDDDDDDDNDDYDDDDDDDEVSSHSPQWAIRGGHYQNSFISANWKCRHTTD